MSKEHDPYEQEYLLALEYVSPVTVQEWRRRSGMSGTARAWTDYSLLFNHYAESLRRGLYTPEDCEAANIVELVNTEFALLSDVLAIIFPERELAHKSYQETAPEA
ncbi:MAG: hypothetical protein ACRDHW_09470 [Ktedonobacteraceae bacterium]